jgi:hypothetical protein
MPDWNTDATTYNKPVVLYEFGYEGKAQASINTSTSYETVLGLSEADAATLATQMQALIDAYKLDNRFHFTVTLQMQQFLALAKSSIGFYYNFGGTNQWAIRVGGLGSAVYKSHDAIRLFNDRLRRLLVRT